MLCFLDTAIVIYLVEQTPRWSARAEQRVTHYVSTGNQIVISDLVRMECLVGPFKRRDASLHHRFLTFFQAQDTVVVGISATICEQAAQIRADYGFKPMDALHLAAAIEYGCQSFLTNDLRLARFTGLAIETLA